MDGDTLKRKIKNWADEVGPQRAKVALVNAGLGLSTSEKLVAGNYPFTPKGKTAFALKQLVAEIEKKSKSRAS